MRAIIAGGGNVGRHLAADLLERGHEVTLIEQESGPAAKAEQSAPGVDVIMGDACELWVLEKASIETAIVAILREGHVVIPQPETVLAPGDEIIVLTTPEAQLALSTAVVGESE